MYWKILPGSTCKDFTLRLRVPDRYKLTPEASCPHTTRTGKRQNRLKKNQGMLGNSSKSWGVPRLHPVGNFCMPIWAEPLCFTNTPLPSSVLPVHLTGEMLLKHTYLSLLQLWTVLCNVLLLQFLIYRNSLYWVGREKKEQMNSKLSRDRNVMICHPRLARA